MTIKILGKPSGELNLKRLALPDVTIEQTCPKCGKIQEFDMHEDYLDCPLVNESFDWARYCRECGHEWDVKAILKISLEVVEG